MGYRFIIFSKIGAEVQATLTVNNYLKDMFIYHMALFNKITVKEEIASFTKKNYWYYYCKLELAVYTKNVCSHKSLHGRRAFITCPKESCEPNLLWGLLL